MSCTEEAPICRTIEVPFMESEVRKVVPIFELACGTLRPVVDSGNVPRQDHFQFTQNQEAVVGINSLLVMYKFIQDNRQVFQVRCFSSTKVDHNGKIRHTFGCPVSPHDLFRTNV